MLIRYRRLPVDRAAVLHYTTGPSTRPRPDACIGHRCRPARTAALAAGVPARISAVGCCIQRRNIKSGTVVVQLQEKKDKKKIPSDAACPGQLAS